MGLGKLFGRGHDKDKPVQQWRFSGENWNFDVDMPGIIGVRIRNTLGGASTIDIDTVKAAFDAKTTDQVFPNVAPAVIADLGLALQQPHLPLASGNYYIQTDEYRKER